jgi:predicted transcriptional regulator of viral defense system
MTYRSPKTALRALYLTANGQGGYFTTKQAAAAGYTKQHVDYHVKAGNFRRVSHGLYRLPTIPISEHDEFIRLSLWSRGRDDIAKAVVSHESALALHQLGDLLPGKVHLTVPRTFRKIAPRGCALHVGKLSPADAAESAGFRITTPLRTLTDAADSNTVPAEQLQQAVADAMKRGLVRRSALAAAAKKNVRISNALKRLRYG